MREILREPVYSSWLIRSRRMNCTPGTSAAIAGRMESEPRKMVSCKPRERSKRSVKT